MTEYIWFHWDGNTLWTTNNAPSRGEQRMWVETGWLFRRTRDDHFVFEWPEGGKHISKEMQATTIDAARSEAEDLWLSQYEGLARGAE